MNDLTDNKLKLRCECGSKVIFVIRPGHFYLNPKYLPKSEPETPKSNPNCYTKISEQNL